MNYAQARQHMVRTQLKRRGIAAPAVLAAMREVPREAFVPEHLAQHAYEDRPLPIEAGQTISQPFMVAAMIEAAELERGNRVLEIGAGSGYAAAVMSRIAAHVYAIERHAELVEIAAARLKRLGYDTVELHVGDGTEGLPDAAPFDAIIASAGGPFVPQVLKEQLEIGGRLVMPVGDGEQRLLKITRASATHLEEEDLGGVAFVPLIGAHGWKESDHAH
ncbi:protein-L-isoaspartate(D-aspartate) O-methyltransferase [Terricaulis silvestris]|uniref:Protein-L-isoaspartate O-methyltransferase n=1 Tax=Terricaulis silvestris TaxID=2686094 RepID=A0A6I6MT41_9CAUL|nr:protein-L-isoaspartate(D-aspartate) O-methyltransferase [Terricaulis silvestris]QGZ95947.1 Protein-L-isoaspartate O-methyltransferase [Terricaulis silvestris]